MSDTPSTASRLDELEMRAVHQDQTIEDLNAGKSGVWGNAHRTAGLRAA